MCSVSQLHRLQLTPLSPSVSSTGESDVLCDGAKYPDSWMSVCNTDRSKIAVLIPDAHVTHFWSPNGSLYTKFPAVHHATGTLVYVVGPAVNSCVVSILRDMPELMPYKPEVPDDLEWAGKLVESVPLRIDGIVLQDPAAEVHMMNLR